MKYLGLKRLILISVMLLVVLSVSISNYTLYIKQKNILTQTILNQAQSYVSNRGEIIEALLNSKVHALEKIANQYNTSRKLPSSPQKLIETTQFIADAMGLNSAMIALNNGDAYWNQENHAFPGHKYAGDARDTKWFKASQTHAGVTITDPYYGSGSKAYWISIIKKINDGALSVDMQLSFLNNIIKKSKHIPGAVMVILNQDTTFLASSSDLIKAGQKGTDFDWFRDTAREAVSKTNAVIHYQQKDKDKIFFSHRINVGDKHWYFAVALDKSVAFAQLNSARNSAIIIALIATIVSVIIAYFVILMVYRPILQLKQTILDLSQGNGDLTQRLEVTSKDDLGEISTGVNQFVANLHRMMLDIQDATSTLQQNVGHLREQSLHNNTVLQQHTSETDQIVTAIEEMNSTATSMATDAANTANLTQQANDTSIDSRRVVEMSQQTISALVTNVEQSAADVQHMSDETQNINNILTVIGEIAEQTNLLALNAAIEAARAGEQGRGFAVVADEVRNLASRTKGSTTEIETALQRLLQGTQEVVQSMDHTKERCQEAAEDSSRVANSLETVTTFVDEINQLNTQIATATEEQNSVTQELSRNMVNIKELIDELNTSSQRALTETEEIDTVNQHLVSIVNQFKL
jgi:methyl-accepting chemotaxis protein